jgi:hypothetical protein
MLMGPDPHRPSDERGQRQTLILLLVVAGLVLAMVIVVASQRFA